MEFRQEAGVGAVSVPSIVTCSSPWGQTGAMRKRSALYSRRSIPRSRRSEPRRSRVARPRRRAAGRPDRRRNRPTRLLQRRRLQQHRSLLGPEPVDNVAARQGMVASDQLVRTPGPERSFRLHSENTRCATGVQRPAGLAFPSAKSLVVPTVSLLVQSAAQANTYDRGRAALRIADCGSPSRVPRRHGSCGARLVQNPDRCLVWRPARPGFDPSQRERPVCGWRTFGLFGRRIAKTSPGRPHIPEVAAHQIVLTLVVVQHRSERRIGMGLRLAFAETGPDGSGV
jgi:hypothetical protein